KLLDIAVERQAAHDAAATREAKVQAHLQAAREQADAGDFAAALAHLGSAAEIDPASPAIAPQRAAIEQQRAAAEERGRRESHDRRAAELVAAARAQFAAGDHQQALTRCERFAPPHPLVTELHRALSGQLAAIEQARAESEQRAHDARLAQLRAEQEARAHLADAPTMVGGDKTVLLDESPLADRVLADSPLAGRTPSDRARGGSADGGSALAAGADGTAAGRALAAAGGARGAAEAAAAARERRGGFADLARSKQAQIWAVAASVAILVAVGTWRIVRQPTARAADPVVVSKDTNTPGDKSVPTPKDKLDVTT